MKKIYGYIEDFVPNLLFLTIFLIMLLQIGMRTFTSRSFSWTVELSQYMNVWITFLGIGYLRKMNSHIKIEMFSDALDRWLPTSARVTLYMFKKILNVAFMVLLVYFGFELARRSWNFRSPAMQLRQYWLYVCVPIGALGYLFREVQDIYRVYKTYLGGRK